MSDELSVTTRDTLTADDWQLTTGLEPKVSLEFVPEAY
jgi:hypothetical protein